MKRGFVVIAVIVFILGLAGCNSTMRQYNEDIVLPLNDPSEKIIIKEWTFLSGSGAEIYYQSDKTSPVLLGKTTGADYGFCPFNEGLYELTQEDGAVTIKWAFRGSDEDKRNWRSVTFYLP